MKKIKLGIIGLSEGNGHPYSWSAIFNGYNPEFMKECPFPVIPEYLSKQNFPDDSIPDAQVSHIWTQDCELSKKIALASNIKHVVKKHTDLIGKVDGILLARDDHETHYELSKPFIDAGLPIYIDKPISIKKNITQKIFDLEKYPNQIFTCSALRYSKEFILETHNLKQLGKIKQVNASIMKCWNKYSIHIIEPVLKLLIEHKVINNQNKTIKTQNILQKDTQQTTFLWDNGLITKFSTMGSTLTPITINIIGTKGKTTLTFKDTFYAFKKSLETFIQIIKKQTNPIPKYEVLQIVDLIEKGKNYE